MSSPTLAYPLIVLRASFNERFFNRPRGSDGWIGDAAHREETSGHNPDDTAGVKAERQDSDSLPEVRAIDVTAFPELQAVIDAILASAERERLIYIIYRGRIWRKAGGWRSESYPGTDQHFGHVHFSSDPASDTDGASWYSVLNFGGDMASIAEIQAIVERLDGRETTILYDRDVNEWNIKGETNELKARQARQHQELASAVTTLTAKVDALTAAVGAGVSQEALNLAVAYALGELQIVRRSESE